MSFSISNTLGPWVTDTFTPSIEYPLPPMAVGTIINGINGTEWMFVRLANSQTIAAGDFVYMSSTDTSFAVTSLANAARTLFGALVGVAGAAATSGTSNNPFIWICRKGVFQSANVVTGATVNALARTTATAGRLGTASSAGVTAQISGVAAVTTPASNLATVVLNYPVISTAD